MGAHTSTFGPETINELGQITAFNEEELNIFYNDFKGDYPDGTITMDQFKQLYCKFFPAGNSEKFAEHVFRSFDLNHDGVMEFQEFIIGISVTTRGSHEQKMKWAFSLYDRDMNGYITKEEANEIIETVNKMMSKTVKSRRSSTATTKKMFDAMDTNHDGRLSLEEFVKGSKTDPSFVSLLQCEHI